MHKKLKKVLAGIITFIFIIQSGGVEAVFAQAPLVPEDAARPAERIALYAEEVEADVFSGEAEEEEKLLAAEEKLLDADAQLQEAFLEETETDTTVPFGLRAGESVLLEGSSVYANGVPIVVKEEAGCTYIFDRTGATKLLPDAISANVSVYGGSKEGDVASASVVMESGTVANIVGGGRSGSVLGKADVTLSGGTVTGLVCGGSKDAGANVQSTEVRVSGSAKVRWIYGGGYAGYVSGSTSVVLSGGQAEYVCGGGYAGYVSGNTSVKIENATITDTVFGGGWSGKVEGSTETILGNGSSVKYLCGGGYMAKSEPAVDSTVTGDTKITIDGGTVTENAYGGGWDGTVLGQTAVSIHSGTINNLYGGGYGGAVSKNTQVEMQGGKVTTTLYGGGQKETATVLETNIVLSGGSVGWTYGGGWKGKITQAANLEISGATVENIAFGGGHFVEAEAVKTNVTVKNAASNVNVLYGAGEWGSVLENSAIEISDGTLQSVYGGGRAEEAGCANSRVSVSGGAIGFLYGGGNAGSIGEAAAIEITNGALQSVYGGGADGSVKNTQVTLSGGTVGFLYGGGKNGSVSETARLRLRGGTVSGNAYGGGRSTGSTVQNTDVQVTGGTLGSVFGGGEAGAVTGQAQIVLNSPNRVSFVCGGGYYGAAGQALTTIKQAEVQTLYGGGYAGHCTDAKIVMENGELEQAIVGSGTGGTATNAALMVSGGLILDVFAGYEDAISLQFSGGSILKNRAGSVVNQINEPVYQTAVTVGSPAVKSQAVTCQVGDDAAWSSKTDAQGRLMVYLPAAEKNLTVRTKAGTAYTGKVTANQAGTAAVTLSDGTDASDFLVEFSVMEGSGTVEATANGVPVESGSRVDKGAKVIFTATADAGAAFQSWWRDGSEDPTFTNPFVIQSLSQNITMEAVFSEAAVDKEALRTAVLAAEAAKEHVDVSIDGNDIETDQKWVTRSVMTAFQAAIQSAKNMLNKPGMTQADIDQAADSLVQATEDFLAAIQDGHGTGSGVDRKALNALLTELQEDIGSVVVSTDGLDVETGTKWVVQQAMDDILAAVQAAEGVADDPAALQDEIDAAFAALREAADSFSAAQEDGKKAKTVPLTFRAVGNGSVSARIDGTPIQSPYMVSADDTVLILANPETGYRVSRWTQNGTAVNGAEESLILHGLTEATTVTAYFREAGNGYMITVDDAVTGGLIGVSPGGMVEPGAIVTVSVLPDEGYYLVEDSLQYNGTAIANGQFVMPAADVFITGAFAPEDEEGEHLLTVTYGAGGTATGSGLYQKGETVQISAKAATGYRFLEWESQDENLIEDKKRAITTLTMPGKPVQVKALFAVRAAGGGGSSTQTPLPLPPKKIEEPVPVTIQKEEASVTATLAVSGLADGQGTAIIHIPEADLKAAVNACKKEAGAGREMIVKVDIQAQIPENGRELHTVHIVLPKAALSYLETRNVARLWIETGLVSVNLDQKAVGSIIPKQQDSVQISVSPMQNLTAQAKQMSGGRPVYEMKILSDQQQIKTFAGGTLVLGIPYSLREEEQAELVQGMYIDESGIATVWPQAEYDEALKKLSLTTTHLSAYGVTYPQETEAEQQDQDVQFRDIVGHWAKDDILALAGQGLVSGTEADQFSPDGKMTRAMLVTVLGRVAGVQPEYKGVSAFSDAAAGAYYTPYVLWAADEGIAAGTGEGQFSPDAPVTREQLAVLLSKYAEKEGIALTATGNSLEFGDNAEISTWARDAVYALAEAGILYGRSETSFVPKGEATRAEVCAVLNRLLNQ